MSWLGRIRGLFGAVASVTLSDVGLKRLENQDRIWGDDSSKVYAVADGMGGAREGGRAAELIIRELKLCNAAHAASDDFLGRVLVTKRGLEDANQVIFEYAREKGYAQMGSTAAVLVLDRLQRGHGAALWVGDSRVYCIHRGVAVPLTRDHRFGFTNALTRAIGVLPEVLVDMREIKVAPGDRLLICTDGVHGTLNDRTLGTLAGKGTLAQASEAIRAAVLAGGAPDNFSLVLVTA